MKKITPLTAEQQELAARFVPLAHRIVKENMHRKAVASDPDEAFSFACEILCKSARTYDASISEPSTYFYGVLTKEFQGYRAQSVIYAPLKPTESIPDTTNDIDLDHIPESDPIPLNPTALKLVEECLHCLPAREAELLSYIAGVRGFPKLTPAEIANQFGISTQRVYQVIERAVRKIRAKLGVTVIHGDKWLR